MLQWAPRRRGCRMRRGVTSGAPAVQALRRPARCSERPAPCGHTGTLTIQSPPRMVYMQKQARVYAGKENH